jgi:hypothetical protein
MFNAIKDGFGAAVMLPYQNNMVFKPQLLRLERLPEQINRERMPMVSFNGV